MDCWLVQKMLRDARLLLARRPPSCNLAVLLLDGRHWELSRCFLVRLPSLRDRAASDQGPGHLTDTYGVVAARRSPMDDNRPTPHVPQPLLHWVRPQRASLALTDSDVALLTEQPRGGERHV